MQKSFLRLRFTATRYRFAGSTDSQLATLKQLSVFTAGLHRTGTRLKSEGRGGSAKSEIVRKQPRIRFFAGNLSAEECV